jgi:hypothetical protein
MCRLARHGSRAPPLARDEVTTRQIEQSLDFVQALHIGTLLRSAWAPGHNGGFLDEGPGCETVAALIAPDHSLSGLRPPEHMLHAAAFGCGWSLAEDGKGSDDDGG